MTKNDHTHIHLVLMGVAGSGKTTILHALADRLGWSVAEGDAFHPEANVAKMHAGHPLTDEDRWPWLERIVTWTEVEDAAGRDTLVTCSALRRVYRDKLREAEGRTICVHLTGAEQLIAGRMAARAGHFMPTSLLPSQIATLEPLESDEDGILVNVNQTTDAIADEIIERLGLQPVALHQRPADADQH